MAYVVPTATELKARFGEFSDVPDATVTAVISDAERSVSTSWLERDYAPAIMLLAAHYLTMEGEPNRSLRAAGSELPLGAVSSYQVDGVKIDYSTAGAGGRNVIFSGSADFELTPYGKRFLALRRANFAGPMVA